MANLKEIRTRIASVTSTRQITSAMKMVAAAKLKKAQNAVTGFRPYVENMRSIMANLSVSSLDDVENVYGARRGEVGKVLLVLITSNKGLCGAFNSNVIKEAMRLAEEKYGDKYAKGDLHFATLGKKGFEALCKRNVMVDNLGVEVLDKVSFDRIRPVAEQLMELYTSGRYDRIELVYNQFINTAVQRVVAKEFLPLEADDIVTSESKSTAYNYIYEPSQEYMVKELIPQNLKLTFYGAVLDSSAAELGARMTAMHQATDNATELIKDLTLQYNKARQTAITNEIVEIVGGAEALKG